MSIDCRIDFDIVHAKVTGGIELNGVVQATISWLPSMECGEKKVERILDPGISDLMRFLDNEKVVYVTYYCTDHTKIKRTVWSVNDLYSILEYERKVTDIFKVKPCVVLEKVPLSPTRVIFNDPATIVFWNDGTKTIVKCSENDAFTKEGGFAAALAKKMYKTGGIKKILKGAVDQKEVTDGQ